MRLQDFKSYILKAHNLDDISDSTLATHHKELTNELLGYLGHKLKPQKPDIDAGNGASSKHFMISALPFIDRLINEIALSTSRKSLSVLDVGVGSGAGSELLASLYPTRAFASAALQVTGLDIREDYRPYIEASTRRLSMIYSDVFKLERAFDIILCFHVIEHVPDPIRFIGRLKELSRYACLVMTPYEEPTQGRTKGHLHSFGLEFLDRVEPSSWSLVSSPAWGRDMHPNYQMLLMKFDGYVSCQSISNC